MKSIQKNLYLKILNFDLSLGYPSAVCYSFSMQSNFSVDIKMLANIQLLFMKIFNYILKTKGTFLKLINSICQTLLLSLYLNKG